jgi:hypothetical protein
MAERATHSDSKRTSSCVLIPTFTSSFFTGDKDRASMVLVTHTGQIFTFSNVELELFHRALTAGDLDSLKRAQARIETDITSTTMGILNSCGTVPGSYLLATEKGVARLVLGEDDDEEELMLTVDS